MQELEKVKEALSKEKFFDKDSERILNSAEDLESIIIAVEKRVSSGRIDFKYDSKKSKFIRLNMIEDEKDYLEKYKDCSKCQAPCFSTELSTDQFLELISKSIFQRISIKLA